MDETSCVKIQEQEELLTDLFRGSLPQSPYTTLKAWDFFERKAKKIETRCY